MDLALGLAVAPLQREASFHRIIVPFYSLSKVLELCNALCFDLREPGIQPLSLSLPQHAGKVGDEFICLCDLLISLTQLGQVLLLPVQALFLFKGNPMSYLGSCGWTLGRSLDGGLSGRIHLFEGP